MSFYGHLDSLWTILHLYVFRASLVYSLTHILCLFVVIIFLLWPHSVCFTPRACRMLNLKHTCVRDIGAAAAHWFPVKAELSILIGLKKTWLWRGWIPDYSSPAGRWERAQAAHVWNNSSGGSLKEENNNSQNASPANSQSESQTGHQHLGISLAFRKKQPQLRLMGNVVS